MPDLIGPEEWGLTLRPSPAPGWGLSEGRIRVHRRRSHRCAVRLTRWAAAVLGGLLMCLAVLVGTATPAVADPISDIICGITYPETDYSVPGDGPESIAPNLNLAEITNQGQAEPPTYARDINSVASLDGLTIYEVAGLRGTVWTVMPITPEEEQSCSLIDWAWTQAGNGISWIKNALLQAVIALKEVATTGNPLQWLYDDADSTVAALFVEFAIPMAIVMVVFLGIGAAVASLKTHGVRAMFGAIAAGLLIIIVLGFLYAQNAAQFKFLAEEIDGKTSAVTTAVTDSLFSTSGSGGGICEVPDSGPNRGQRITSCMLAEALAYRPFVLGIFGNAAQEEMRWPDDPPIDTAPDGGRGVVPCYVGYDGCQDPRSYLLTEYSAPYNIGATIPRAQRALCYASIGAFPAGFDYDDVDGYMECDPLYAAYDLLSDQPYATTMQGTSSMNRVMHAIMALIGTLMVGGMVALLSIVVLVWTARTFGLFLIGPIKLVIAMWPGKSAMAKDWGQQTLYTFGAKVIYGIALALVVLVTAWVFSATLPIFLQLVWLAVLLWTLWKIVQKAQDAIQVKANMGGQDTDSIRGAGARGGRLATGAVDHSAGAATGAGAGVVSTVRRRRAEGVIPETRAGRLRRGAGTAARAGGAGMAGAMGGARTGASGQSRDRRARKLWSGGQAGPPGMGGPLDPTAKPTVRRRPPAAGGGAGRRRPSAAPTGGPDRMPGPGSAGPTTKSGPPRKPAGISEPR